MSRSSPYRIVHEDLKRTRGSAVGRPCAAPGCPRLADGWGLVGDATHYGEDSQGRAVRWSTDLRDYAPLCDSHNAQLDRGGDWQHCPAGHYRLTWGTHSNGECRGCSRVRSRAYHAARRDDPAYRERRRRRNQQINRARRAALARSSEQHDGRPATTRGTTPA